MTTPGFGADVLLSLLVVALALAVYSRLRAITIDGIYPPTGTRRAVDGTAVHFVDVPADRPDAPVLVLIHGASGNLRDPMLALRARLQGRYRLLLVDRPGHGWSARAGRGDAAPTAQAGRIAGLMSELGIGRAIVLGHSWGGSVAAAFAVHHPEKTAGLVFLAPATHPWEGGVTWYYRLAAMPVIGRIFCEVLVLPIAKLARDRGIRSVFSPAEPPDDYAEDAHIDLSLRPATFRANAEDIAGLIGHVTALSPRYREISAPTAIIADDADRIVYTHIHSVGLERDIAGARLIRVADAGHMPHHTRTDTVVAAIDEVAARGEEPAETVA
ncbi:alpha/beta fold hydrolase [Rhodobium gokarnense]|uniref:Pimeloyl-ACP methyl ester carboxylesterase n=1 Tax=Rhodobium gokarnense TaxID=364296 RepID=A0ABT3HD12_9HYPH|nr:alpha/beta hydrolase [Rhodobium gokarnense]MCW2308219.1 pimeloyl-ACP methyl ester carboxylesterase [Rhodobium gokarnense]